MTLQDMFHLSQIVAALAIIGSLLFVAVEMRGSNQANRHRRIEELLEDYRGVRMQIAANADCTRAWRSGLHNYAALDPLDKVRFSLVADLFFNTHQSIYLHYRGGRMERSMYEPQRLNMTDFLRYPGLQAIWDVRKHYFTSAYQSYVDRAIATARGAGSAPNLYGESPSQFS